MESLPLQPIGRHFEDLLINNDLRPRVRTDLARLHEERGTFVDTEYDSEHAAISFTAADVATCLTADPTARQAIREGYSFAHRLNTVLRFQANDPGEDFIAPPVPIGQTPDSALLLVKQQADGYFATNPAVEGIVRGCMSRIDRSGRWGELAHAATGFMLSGYEQGWEEHQISQQFANLEVIDIIGYQK